MKVLVIGNGGREHALIKTFQEDPSVKTIYTLPERHSIPKVAGLHQSLLNNYSALAQTIAAKNIELVVIGPEKPLVEGMGDFLRTRGIKVFGPSSLPAQLEGSKIFAKAFMQEQNIPTASYEIVSSVSQTLELSQKFSPPYVLKADGLAGGKGVFLCANTRELKTQAALLFEKKVLGSAGEKALLEAFQQGSEMSIFVITNGPDYRLLPVARDYKKLQDGHKGPNTGGMGAIAPIKVSPSLMDHIEQSIVKPTILGLQKKHIPYLGVLYIGLMITPKKQAVVLEYNARFGDPEAQVLLPLLDGSWAHLFYEVAKSPWEKSQLPVLKWKNIHTACVVLASPLYPRQAKTGLPIKGSIYHKTPDSYFLHGGVTINKARQAVTSGGRVLNAVAIGKTPAEARQRSYQQAQYASWDNQQYRKDIGS